MAKNSVPEWSTTAASNTDIGGTSILGTAAISNFDNALRTLMAQVATYTAGSAYHIFYYDLLASTTIPAAVNNIVMWGRRAFGDGAGIIPAKRVSVAPTTHNGWGQSADGTYWEFNVGDFANVKAFGARGNGTTNDQAAIQGAVDYIDAKFGAGRVFVPGSTSAYLCTSQITLATADIDFFGANKNVTIHAGPNDITLMKIEESGCRVSNLTFLGCGSTGLATADTTAGITATAPCVWVASTAVDSKVEHCIIKGGTGLKIEGGDNKFSFNEVTRSYGPYLVEVSNGHYFIRNAMDQEWPVSFPTYQSLPSPMTAWTAGAVVTAGDVRELSGFYIQCTVGGTCGGTTPTLKNYVVDITDGATVKWRLVCKNTYHAYYLDDTAQEVSINQQDISGCFTVGIGVDAANTSLRLKLRDTIIGQTIRQGLLIEGGKDIQIWNIHTGTGCQIGYASAEVSGAVTGHVNIDKCWFEGGKWSFLLDLDTGGTASVDFTNNYLKPAIGGGANAIAIEVTANQTDFDLDGNTVASGAVDGVIIGSGCDHYHLTKTKNKARLTDAKFIQGVVPGPNIHVEGNV